MIATAHVAESSMMMDKVVTSADLRKGRKSNKMMRDLWGLSSSQHRMPAVAANGSIAKTYWPELVGRKVDEATELISRNQPYLLIEKVGWDTDDLTSEYHAQRVQLFVDDKDVVIHAPQIG